MSSKPNHRQLVLRRDSATGLTQVGWEVDLPVGRFEHLELVCELTDNILPDIGNEFYPTYQAALQRAREANKLIREQQARHNQAMGWYLVPFELADLPQTPEADSIGNYAAAAMRLHILLTQKTKQAWAVMQEGAIVHVRARQPRKALDELSYQVWYHQQYHQLQTMGGTLLEGNLIICESGLWFEANL